MTNEEYNTVKKFLAKTIKQARIKHHYTIRELAEITEINYSYLSQIENNHIDKPSLFIYLTLFETLEIPISDLFYDIESMPPFNRYPPES
ncbi:helix-turn-helix transcriptional regulator [Enterococcus casseliflavus]|uniref:helix-turn-helix domain-containing protein n=1 Tax=Enterococcus casseliflavus TaxID=37734 RepID=UPI00115D69CA